MSWILHIRLSAVANSEVRIAHLCYIRVSCKYSELSVHSLVNRLGFSFHFERVTKCSNKQNEWSYKERLQMEKRKPRQRTTRESCKKIIRCSHIYLSHARARTHWKTVQECRWSSFFLWNPKNNDKKLFVDFIRPPLHLQHVPLLFTCLHNPHAFAFKLSFRISLMSSLVIVFVVAARDRRLNTNE